MPAPPLLMLALLPFAISVNASDLETPHYQVQIDTRCAEGNVTCDQVIYQGKSKVSGNSIELIGETWHTTCADGVSPCRFLGYRFRNGNVIYYVHETGYLEVIRNKAETQVSEQGQWQY
jgi:hypothetical protein